MFDSGVILWGEIGFQSLLGVQGLTKRFQIAVHLFIMKSQFSSKCGKNKKVANMVQPSVSLIFFPHFHVFCDLIPFSSIIPGISFAFSPDNKLPASSGSNVVCLLGFFHAPTSLARSLLWAIPAQQVRPISCRITCLISAAISDPILSLSWQPQGHAVMS